MYANRIASVAAILLLAASPMALAQTGAADPATRAPGAAATAPGAAATGTVVIIRQPAQFLDQDQITRRLEGRDFSDIQIERDNGAYTGTAQWYGEEVDLRVNARTGRVESPTRLTADQVRHRLEGEGYEDIADLQEDGDQFTGRATRFGEEQDLRVSARTGHVLDPRELTMDQIRQKLQEEHDADQVVLFERDQEYGNIQALIERDDSRTLVEIHPITGQIVNQREES